MSETEPDNQKRLHMKLCSRSVNSRMLCPSVACFLGENGPNRRGEFHPGNCTLVESLPREKQNAEGWVLMADEVVVGF